MNIQTSFLGMEPTDALNSYVNDKLTRHEQLLISATSIKAEFIENSSTKGVKSDFRFELNIVLPKAVVRVEEVGEEMYALVDKAVDVAIRKVNRYLDKRTNWDGVTPWSDLEAMADETTEDVDVVDTEFINYEPKISSRKKLENMSPMAEAEAIERMELMGESQILFKSSQSGKWSMIYKDSKGNYCLVEPSNEI